MEFRLEQHEFPAIMRFSEDGQLLFPILESGKVLPLDLPKEVMMENRKFWMVYVEGKHSPTFKHPTEEDAEDEARRLAEDVGQVVYVLEALAYAKRAVQIDWTILSSGPQEKTDW